MNAPATNTAVPQAGFLPNPKARLREQFHEVARFRHLAGRSEEMYWSWVVRFLIFCRDHPHLTPALSPPSEGAEREKQWRHPRDLSPGDISAFLSHLAADRKVAAATQNQALNALIFLYREVLHLHVAEIGAFERAKRPARLPEVLSRAEVKRVLVVATPEYQLPLRLLYGTGLRLMELLRLRVHPVR